MTTLRGDQRFVFVIGRPGSGKSTVVDLLAKELTATLRIGLLRLNDRDILLSFARDESYSDMIGLKDGINFKVLNPDVYRLVTMRFIESVEAVPERDRTVVLIEFSRNEYTPVFDLLSPPVSNRALIVYVDAPFQLCLARNKIRSSQGCHVVPDDEMRTYFKADDRELLKARVEPSVHFIENSAGIESLRSQVSSVVQVISRGLL